jgi:hypothetical protein
VPGSPRKPKPLIGWREWVAFPALENRSIKAKVDTGARSSALHAFDIEIFQSGEQEMVRFKVHPIQNDARTTVEGVAPLIDRRPVRSSAGQTTIRPVVAIEIELAGERWPIELTLTRRDAMGFRMLLGRQAVRRRFQIEPARSFLARGKGSSLPRKKRRPTE